MNSNPSASPRHALVAAGRNHEQSIARMGDTWPATERVVRVQVVDHLTTAMRRM